MSIKNLDPSEHQDLAQTSSNPNELHELGTMYKPGEGIHTKLLGNTNTAEKTIQHIHGAAKGTQYEKDINSEVLDHPNVPQKLVHAKVDAIKYPTKEMEGSGSYGTYDISELLKHPKISYDKFMEHKKKFDKIKDSSWRGDLDKHEFKHPDAPLSKVKEAIKHKDLDIAKYGATHPKADPKDIMAFLKRKDLTHDGVQNVLEHGKNLTEDHLRHIYKTKFKEDRDYGGSQQPETQSEVLRHQNTPKDIIDAAVKQKGEEHYYRDSPRKIALSHQHTPIEELSGIVKKSKKDREAAEAALGRSDTPEDLVRHINKNVKKEKGVRGYQASGYESMISKVLAHPNTPDDILKERSILGKHEGEQTLKRQNLSTEVLEHIVTKHKNQDVAVSALSHSNVTKDIVDKAFKRKAGKVSRAAAQHELAPDEMVEEKLRTDKAALPELAGSLGDENWLRQVHEKGNKEHEVNENLWSNSSTPSDVLGKIIDQYKLPQEHEDRPKETSSYGHVSAGNFPGQGYRQRENFPENLTNDHLVKMMKHHSAGWGHPDISPDMFRDVIDHYSNENPDNVESVLDNVLEHKNVDEPLLKDIVSGKWGRPSEHRYSGERDDVIENRDAITPEVIKAGLDAQPDFASSAIVEELASNPNFKGDDLKNKFEHATELLKQGISGSPRDEGHYKAMSHGIAQNPNTDPETLMSVFGEDFNDPSFDDLKGHVIENKSLPDEQFKEIYQKGGWIGSDAGKNEEIREQIKERGLLDHALQNADMQHVLPFLQGSYTRELNEGNMEKSLGHTNPGAKDAIFNYIKQKRGDQSFRLSEAQREKFLDPHILQDDALRKEHFGEVSLKGREEYMKGADLSKDPHLIQGLESEQIRDLKIGPETSEEAVIEILSHDGRTGDHFLQAVEHHPENEDVMGRAVINAQVHPGQQEEIWDKVIENNEWRWGDQARKQAAKHSSDPERLNHLMTERDDADKYIDNLIQNNSLSGKDFDAFTKYEGEDKRGVHESLVAQEGTTVKMLNHIAEQTPELHNDLAQHKKASNPKLIKTLLAKGDHNTRVSLANNNKVPEKVKMEILKDPGVLAEVDPDQIPTEKLDEWSTSDDPRLVRASVSHPESTTDIKEKASRKVMEHLGEENYVPSDEDLYELPKEKEQYFEHSRLLNELSRKQLNPTTQRSIALSHPELAANVIETNDDIDSETLSHILGTHTGDQNVIDKAINNSTTQKSPIAISKILDQVDLDYKNDTTENLAELLEKSAVVKDEHWNKVWEKFKDRPEGKTINTVREAGDTDLFKHIIKYGPNNIQDEMIDQPETHTSLLENRRLSQQNFKKILDAQVDKDWSEESLLTSALTKHPAASGKDLEEIYNISEKKFDEKKQNEDGHREIGIEMARHKNATPKILDKILRDEPEASLGVLQNPNVSDDTIRHALEEGREGKRNRREYSSVGANKNFDIEKFKKLMPDEKIGKGGGDVWENVEEYYSQNPNAKSQDLDYIYNNPTGDRKELSEYIIQNPRASKELVGKMVKDGSVEKSDAAMTTWGYDQLRKQPSKFPESLNLKKGTEGNEATFRQHEDKVKSVIDQIPKDDHLDWAKFKKENPGLSENPGVKKLFTSAPKQRVTKEHAKKYMEDYPFEKKFHVSYDDKPWTGMQKHNNKKQLVVQINMGEEQDAAHSDPTVSGLHKLIKKGQEFGGHPVKPHTIGWARVDTSDPDNWHIDEIQSDYGSGVASEINQAQKQGMSHRLKDYHIDEDKVDPSLQKLISGIQGWDQAAINHILEIAKKNGAKSVTMPSGRAKLDTLAAQDFKSEDAELTNKFNKLYNKIPESMGFEEDTYANVESADKKSKVYKKVKNKTIWRKKLKKEKIEKSLRETFEKLILLRGRIRNAI